MVHLQRPAVTATGLLLFVLFTIVVSAREENDQSVYHSDSSFHKFQEHFWAKFKHFERKMESEVVQLQRKVELLEAKIVNQEKLLKECKTCSDTNIKRSENEMPFDYKVHHGPIKKQSIVAPKTCLEALTEDPSLESGMFLIDPDGQGRGDDPIYVYCNMKTGSSSILHDSEDSIEVGHCFDPGCYSRQIKYNATLRQMAMLAELSNECHQSIDVDCFDAAFEFNGIAYAWWNDRNEDLRYFWSGKNKNSSTSHYHTCECGLDESCIDKSLSCNCDSDLAMDLSDKGVITDKDLLPLTKLNFGRTIAPTSIKRHKLGRMECSGKVVLDGMPKSCQDLWRIGYVLNGLYSIQGSSYNVETVFCDFSKLPGDEDLQTWIGYTDVKSVPVYFNVERNTSTYNVLNEPMPFDWEILNVGNAFNVSSGIFTAPRNGTYFFAFSSTPESSYYDNYFDLKVNGARISGCTSTSSAFNCYILYTARLISGDEVQVSLQQGSTHRALFTGVLLEEADLLLS